MQKDNIENLGSKGRLLIVEDHQVTLDLWAVALRLVGYATMSAGSVAEAKMYLETTSVDLVITDWLLMDGTGDEVCEATRQIKPTIPVVVISGATGNRIEDIITCAPDVYFTKPVKIRTLVETIERLLETARAGESD